MHLSTEGFTGASAGDSGLFFPTPARPRGRLGRRGLEPESLRSKGICVENEDVCKAPARLRGLMTKSCVQSFYPPHAPRGAAPPSTGGAFFRGVWETPETQGRHPGRQFDLYTYMYVYMCIYVSKKQKIASCREVSAMPTLVAHSQWCCIAVQFEFSVRPGLLPTISTLPAQCSISRASSLAHNQPARTRTRTRMCQPL